MQFSFSAQKPGLVQRVREEKAGGAYGFLPHCAEHQQIAWVSEMVQEDVPW